MTDKTGLREQVISSVLENRVIAIVRGVESSLCLKVAEALYAGGIRLIEMTYNQSDPSSWQANADTIGTLARELDGRMLVGAGTVTSVELVEMTGRAGGRFIISPNVNEAVIKRTRGLELVSIPGAMTPTEILNAYDYGADFIKLFPASDLGTAYVKSIKAPISHIPLLATGGITLDNAAAFMKAGCAGLGVGGLLADKAAIAAGDFEKLTRSAKALLETINEA